jgi:hypothetical protein
MITREEQTLVWCQTVKKEQICLRNFRVQNKSIYVTPIFGREYVS